MEDDFSDLFGDIDDDLLFGFPGADFAPSDQPQSLPDEALPAPSVPVYGTAAGDASVSTGTRRSATPQLLTPSSS